MDTFEPRLGRHRYPLGPDEPSIKGCDARSGRAAPDNLTGGSTATASHAIVHLWVQRTVRPDIVRERASTTTLRSRQLGRMLSAPSLHTQRPSEGRIQGEPTAGPRYERPLTGSSRRRSDLLGTESEPAVSE